MKRFIQFFFFISLISILGSCSSSKPTYSSRLPKKKSKPKISNTIQERNTSDYDRGEVIAEALTHIGTRYRYGGKKPKTGFDCSGLVSYSFNVAGLNVKGASFHQANLGRKKARNNLQPGDLVFFGKRNKVNHVAIVIRNHDSVLEVIHSTSSSGVRIDNINDSKYWNQRFLFGRDVIGNIDNYAIGSKE